MNTAGGELASLQGNHRICGPHGQKEKVRSGQHTCVQPSSVGEGINSRRLFDDVRFFDDAMRTLVEGAPRARSEQSSAQKQSARFGPYE